LAQDMRSACLHVMRADGARPKSPLSGTSNIQVITPFNTPRSRSSSDVIRSRLGASICATLVEATPSTNGQEHYRTPVAVQSSWFGQGQIETKVGQWRLRRSP